MLSKSGLLKLLRNQYLLLFLIGLIYYSLYFHHVFLNLNTLLSSSIDDSLKNYYTFVYQIKNSDSLLHFNGFNYPFGEHVVYTDCQPLLTFLLKPFGFAHDYSVGILHFIMFFSILLCPLAYLSIFRKLGLPAAASFCVALAITILSPQYFRIYCGHYALAYACIIPFSSVLLLRYQEAPSGKKIITLLIINSLLFLIHPYYGLGISLFSFFALFFLMLVQKGKRLRLLVHALLAGVLPILAFRGFMFLSDQHPGRSSEPYGNAAFISDLSSFMVPDFGPFKDFLKQVIGSSPQHFEGSAYLGLGLIFLLVISLPFLLLFANKLKLNKGLLSLFFASLCFLLFSFGIQYKIQETFGIKIQALNQFRAMGRFSWFMYYILPLLLFHGLHELFKLKFKKRASTILIVLFAGTYLSFNLYEGHAYFKIYDGLMWEERNVFNSNLLTAEEKALLNVMKEKDVQAILPLPLFYLGSEVYDRSTCTIPMYLSSIYSYHSGIPIHSAYMSRTSVPETEMGIEILNSYKQKRAVDSLLNENPFFVIKTQEPLMEDEKRLWRITTKYTKNDSTEFGFISLKLMHHPILEPSILEIKGKTMYYNDSASVVYIKEEARKPYQESNQLNYDGMYVADTNALRAGSYILSLHYHTKAKTFREMANSLIVTKAKGEEYNWKYALPLKVVSGFGTDNSIVEYLIELEKDCRHEFFIHGTYDLNYRVSNFLLRPETLSVRVISAQNDTLYNNFPRK